MHAFSLLRLQIGFWAFQKTNLWGDGGTGKDRQSRRGENRGGRSKRQREKSTHVSNSFYLSAEKKCANFWG